jgi:glycine dehydrogenase
VFDTLRVRVDGRRWRCSPGGGRRINLRDFGDGTIGVTLDETADRDLRRDLCSASGPKRSVDIDALLAGGEAGSLPAVFARTSVT